MREYGCQGTTRHFIYGLIALIFIVWFCPLKSGLAINKSQKNAALYLKKADRCRTLLLRSSKRKKYRHYWLNCIRRYERIASSYPDSKEAPIALYRAGRLYTSLYKFSGLERDLEHALSLYQRVVEKYAHHSVADDAQYRIGEIYYKYKKDPAKAYVEFLKVDIKFPSGDCRPKARKMLDRLAVKLRKKDVIRETSGAKEGASKVLGNVKDIRHWSTPNYTRVVIDLDRPVKYEHHLLRQDPRSKKPKRIYIDLKGARVSSDIDSQIPIKDGLLHRARAAQYQDRIVRVVLDLESIGGYKVFHLYDPFRIVVDVKRSPAKEEKILTSPKLTTKRRVRKGIRKAKAPDKAVTLARQLGLNVNRIVIDPGHGGKDPGCYLGRGIKEKDIVLRLAKILAKKIRKRLGCEVILTRTKDIFLPLERRTAIANINKADLFISLHVNAHRKRWVSGIETYYLNMATDERAVLVAARENATTQKNISDLQAILNDLLLNTKIHESSRLAYEIQKGMVSELKKRYRHIRSLGVKQAPFYVLIGAQMPSVLIETGFLTNPTERRRLLNTVYEDRLAEGICKGIKRYIDSINLVYQGG
ncbi:MAG: N-acetylmuramoyl-L-alanine amidase [Deltaproteobacteria bacterium]|nr:N-acetylmuramoyl-L-alanine amidase [Deltaproteobacteria bacterium]MBW1929471.1 N-acetylmuramoyl-L-alanine amidase [Deltaproteobacteria bacterium]MBW2023870.1 N-acetylmuramoyl-L-alanine amidase [Deltaproteobacteria bacterium]MBW2124159.1 N-acetylmuramoyl-L-alanine amidase [Deltaproteobacteria bacterium]RLB23881.1 MAG: N-acetylmuramoyl-L-alanine amidase [Deltaproteobacteria bacterium]